METTQTREALTFEPGDATWKRLRKLALTDLWWLNYHLLGNSEIPMRPETHLAMVRFAERKTGIPDIDSARVQRILVPREYGKSRLITLGRTVQNILRDRNWTVGIANETMLMAKGFLGDIKEVFEQNDLIRALFPEVIPDNLHDTIWSADKIVVKRDISRKEPTVLAAGVDRAVTGVHMKEWVLDDILSNEAAENAMTGSFTEIEKIKRWMNRLEPLCDGPGTPISVIGTPWWVGDCYDYAADLWGRDEEPQEYRWSIRLPNGLLQHFILTLQGDIATFRLPLLVDGKITFPEKWPEERWAPIARKDPQLFAANFLLDPASDIVRDFKDSWLLYYDWDIPDKQIAYRDHAGERRFVQVREMDTVMAVDPAISESARADRTGIVVSGTIDGKHHILLEARAERVGVLDLCSLIEQLHEKYRCRRIFVESVAYQKALAQLLFSKRLPIFEVKPGNQKTKEMRIRALEPYFRQGNIYLHHRQTDLIHEYTHFPRSRYDDILDALTYLTDEWSRTLGRDSKHDEARQRADAERIKQLREWSLGRQSTRPRSPVGTFDRT